MISKIPSVTKSAGEVNTDHIFLKKPLILSASTVIGEVRGVLIYSSPSYNTFTTPNTFPLLSGALMLFSSSTFVFNLSLSYSLGKLTYISLVASSRILSVCLPLGKSISAIISFSDITFTFV